LIHLFVIALFLPGPTTAGYDAAMCFTGRFERERYYFSECSTQALDWKAWCAPYKTRFSMRTGPKETRARCEDVVKQNHPNAFRFRNKRRKPIICDFNLEGPLQERCHVERQPIPTPTLVHPPVAATASDPGAVPDREVVAAPPPSQ